ncbi:hypothetical protein [Mesorhizobium sp. L48C026A00]|uniref:hypothetical protein n=1 Tax=Mesorhizobium sp. L48C026A00 TaxID=1287182 RepID=UPI0012EB965B|nr:hypothetical protein [Mesorhizobium sp. L48C026A00]
MPNDNRDWTNGRFMHASLRRAPAPTDKEIIDALMAALGAKQIDPVQPIWIGNHVSGINLNL